MNRDEFHKYFKTPGPVILPVIHVVDVVQVEKNLLVAIQEGAQGVFLINHDFDIEQFLPIIRTIRQKYPSVWLGVNFLGVTGLDAFPILGQLQHEGCIVDAYWADDARIDEFCGVDGQAEAIQIHEAKRRSGWRGMYFGGAAFKKQRQVDAENYGAAAELAREFMDVVTTSGIATGQEADLSKVDVFRQGIGDTPLALASGVNPQNIHHYAAQVDAVLVATGINFSGDFYHIDPNRLSKLVQFCRNSGLSKPAAPEAVECRNNDNDRWYLGNMAPRSRGEKYAWLDPSSAYINARSFHAMLDDLLMPFYADEIDVVAGFDAAGFVLGAGMAVRLGKGFLTIRKGGKIPVDFDVVPMENYSGQTQSMEMRKPAFRPGTRVLLVDQWIETGGTMNAGIALVERQGGVVAGIAAVCIEQTEASRIMAGKYRLSSCVVPGSAIQDQCDRQTLDSFARFKPENCFPEIQN